MCVTKCPACNKIQFTDITAKYDWDYNQCTKCQQWYSFQLIKYKHYVIAVNITEGI